MEVLSAWWAARSGCARWTDCRTRSSTVPRCQPLVRDPPSLLCNPDTRQTSPPVGLVRLWRHRPQHPPHILLHVDAARQANDAVQQRAPGRGWREVGRGAGQGRSTDAGSGSHACCSRAGSRQRAWLSLSRPPAVTPLHWSPAKWPNNPPHLTPISSGVSGVRGPVGDSSSPPATMVRQPPRSHSARMPGRWDAPTTPTTRPPGPLQGCGAGRQATL